MLDLALVFFERRLYISQRTDSIGNAENACTCVHTNFVKWQHALREVDDLSLLLGPLHPENTEI